MRLVSAATAVALFLASSSIVVEELRFGVEKGTRVEKTFEGEGEFTMEGGRFQLNGEDFDDGSGEADIKTLWKKKAVFVDEYRAVSDARPTVLAREFRALEERETASMNMDGDAHEFETVRQSALEGKIVVFTWDDEADAYKPAYMGEEKGDTELLEDLVADTDLLDFLPDEEVAEGDTWKIDARYIHRLMDVGGYMHLLGEEEESDAETERQIEQNQEGEFLATYEGRREVDGVTVVVISLRADVSTHIEVESVDEDGDPVEELTRITSQLEGEILWNRALGRPHSYTIEGDVKADHTETTTWVDDETGDDMVFVMELVMSGTVEQSGTWKKAD